MKDSTGSITTNVTEAVDFTWTASVAKYRTADLQAHKIIATYSAGLSGQFTATIIQQHSSPMSGTFTITLDGVPIKINPNITDIPFNVDSWVLEDGFRQLNGL